MANNGQKSSRVPQKTLKIIPDKNFSSMLRVVFEEGGKVPDVVSGMYNSRKDAQKAIDDWTIGYTRDKIRPREPVNDTPHKIKGKKDGEEKRTS